MKAISSMATRHVLVDLLAAASTAGLPQIELESAGGLDAAGRVAAGEAFDLVFLADDALRRLASGGSVRSDSVTPLVLSQVAAAVRAPTRDVPRPPGPTLSDGADVRRALFAAGRIGYSTGPSGTELVRMIEDWGLYDALQARLVRAPPGVPIAVMLADGDVDLGFQQLSELARQPEVHILGVLPHDCAIETVFSGAVARTAGNPVLATEVLSFLASEAAAPIRRAHGFGMPPA
jgi:molybdate transport system substrate-binding protein